jgi:hypothetical protein
MSVSGRVHCTYLTVIPPKSNQTDPDVVEDSAAGADDVALLHHLDE